ncbi:hypothetical protein QFC22_000992 [Naganishia vaughanmartiniae]|uniref:Uncharacterized protein n=1 Tax=Naganishia vaughanmartiniae TaxID=1424756 RepID=A0ACC2XJK8_9TREE|nr:hypothetical protein QFC22_000992 [Naganishia vaughanmartiniae]
MTAGVMASSLGRHMMGSALREDETADSSSHSTTNPTRFIRALPPSAAAQAIFGNPSPNYSSSNPHQSDRPPAQRQLSYHEAESGLQYTSAYSPNTHNVDPSTHVYQSHSRNSSVNERQTNNNPAQRRRQASVASDSQIRPGSRHRSSLVGGGLGASAGLQGGDESSSSSRRGSGGGRKRSGKEKEAGSRGQSATPSGLRESMSGSGVSIMADAESLRMLDPRDPSYGDEEISTIFIVGFPDDITEREFANMFLFAPGFEASSLKYPTSPSLFSNHNANRSTKDFLTALTQGTTDIPPGLQQHVIAKHGTNPVALLTELMALHEKYSRIRETENDTPIFESSEMTGMDSYYPAHLAQGSTANSSTTSLIGMSMTGKPPPRRQTIGFAKFRSRADAEHARDTLQGRKMDAFYNAVLKVELAKKNLHTKRTPTGSSLGGGSGMGLTSVPGVNDDMMIDFLLKSGKASQAINSLSQAPPIMPSAVPNSSNMPSAVSRNAEYGTERSIGFAPGMPAATNSIMSPQWVGNAYDMPPAAIAGYNGPSSLGYEPMMPMSMPRAMPLHDNMTTRTPLSATSSDPALVGGMGSFEPFREDWATYHHANHDTPVELAMSDLSMQPMQSATTQGSFVSYSNHSGTSLRTIPSNQSNPLEQNIEVYTPTSPQRAQVLSPAVHYRNRDSKALLALAEEADEAEGWTVGGIKMEALGSTDGDSRDHSPSGPNSASHQGRGQAEVVYGFTSPRLQDAALSSDASAAGSRGSLSQQSSYQGLAPIHSRQALDFPQSINAADQNPPINTLYVGNLPSTLSHTHAPNYLEDSLRNLFSRVAGFKRMSFRQKANGPMCFVEFEDVPTATLAMKDLYGHTLGGMIKGGLRLSYSKNSLGQRTNPKQPPPSLSQASLLTSGYTSPSAWGQRSPLSPTSASSTGFSFTPAYPTPSQGGFEQPLTRRSNSFVNGETPLSPLAAPFSTSFSATVPAILPISPRLQQMPVGVGMDDARQGKDGAFSPILPRAAVAVPWKMSSMDELGFTLYPESSTPSTSAPQHTNRSLARSQ